MTHETKIKMRRPMRAPKLAQAEDMVYVAPLADPLPPASCPEDILDVAPGAAGRKKDPRVISYCRVSTNEQGDGSSIQTQQRINQGLALQHNLPDPEPVSCIGTSGSVPILDRPEGKIIKGLVRGDVILAATLDRLFRSSLDGQQMIEAWKKNGVRLIVGGFGELTSDSNPVAGLMFSVIVGFANYERELIQSRVRKGQRAKAARGGYTGGKPPYGYWVEGEGKKAKLIPFDWRSDAIYMMVNLRNEGENWADIARAVSFAYAPITRWTVKTLVTHAEDSDKALKEAHKRYESILPVHYEL
jgi:DNA invertase Pin-like site-specific DNA recombinase